MSAEMNVFGVVVTFHVAAVVTNVLWIRRSEHAVMDWKESRALR